MYKEIKSEFVRNKIKGTKWKDKKYIEALVTLEHFVLKGPHNSVDAMSYGLLMDEYPKEFAEICKELNPRAWNDHLQREIPREKNLKKTSDRLKKEEGQAKKEWVELGGIL